MSKMSDKLYCLAGYSTHNGVRKLRLSNSDKRAAHLAGPCGGTDVVLNPLPYPMTRAQVEEFFANGFVAVEQQEDPVLEKLVDSLVESLMKPKLTLEEALAQIPLREKGRFIAKGRREEMARELMAA